MVDNQLAEKVDPRTANTLNDTPGEQQHPRCRNATNPTPQGKCGDCYEHEELVTKDFSQLCVDRLKCSAMIS